MSDADVKMPEPAVVCDCGGNYYTADQLRAAVLAERERCAKVCDFMAKLGAEDRMHGAVVVATELAAAIRKG